VSSCPTCDFPTGFIVGPAGTYQISFNDVFNNANGNYGKNTGAGFVAFVPSPGTGEISADPEFDSHYGLTANSPALDAGTNDNAPTIDLDGKNRPIDGDGDGVAVVDMGAFEFCPFIFCFR
jgi:hypothetical protein